MLPSDCLAEMISSQGSVFEFGCNRLAKPLALCPCRGGWK